GSDPPCISFRTISIRTSQSCWAATPQSSRVRSMSSRRFCPCHYTRGFRRARWTGCARRSPASIRTLGRVWSASSGARGGNRARRAACQQPPRTDEVPRESRRYIVTSKVQGAEQMAHHLSNGNGANGNGAKGNGSRANGSKVTPTRSRSRSLGSPRSRRVTVIGGAGFVGSVLVPKLLEHGDEVTILDAFLYGTDSVVGHAAQPKLQLVRGDLRNVESVVRACRDADAIVHLGGLVGDPSCAVDEDLTRQINLEST